MKVRLSLGHVQGKRIAELTVDEAQKLADAITQTAYYGRHSMVLPDGIEVEKVGDL